MTERKKLAIIDGKSVFYRGYYAMPNLSTKEGVPTGGVFGFATMALELIKKLQPDYVCVAWDKPKTNIRKRKEMYPDYKAGRKPAPPDFYTQIPILHDLLDAFGWPLYELDDYEADDIMGTLATQAREKGLETQLITSDLDALQLINGHVKVYALKRGFSNIEEYHPESFKAKYGLEPEQFLDLKALKGDSSDNIPGVPGVGEKTAIDLLKEFKTLDGVYKNLNKVKESVRKKLEAGKDSAMLSKKIAAIWCDAPLKLKLSEMDGKNIDVEHLRKLLEDLEFRSLLRNLPSNMQAPDAPREQISARFKLPKYKIISRDEDLESLKLTGDQIFIHSRAAGQHGGQPRVIILGNEADAYALDLAKLNTAKARAALTHLLQAKKLIGYDVKASLKVLYKLGVNLISNHENLNAELGAGEDGKGAVQESTATADRSSQQSAASKATGRVGGSAAKQAGAFCVVGHDVLVGAFLINSLLRAQSLSDLAKNDLNYEGASLEDLPTEDLLARGAEFMAILRELYHGQKLALEQTPKIEKLAKEIEWPLTHVLADMELAGVKLDTGYLAQFSKELEGSISDLEQKIYGYANHEFNISSPSQLADVLFAKLNLPTEGIKKGKTGYSTAASELAKLQGAHPIIELIGQYREAAKLKNTYVDALPKLVDENSRLHTTFNLTIAQTGRLSSTEPNLQNIPIRTELGRNIRKALVADKGNTLISADYSQFELRIAAALSGDKSMIDAFNADRDIHVETAAQIYGIKPEDVTKTQRSSVKEINFGVMYGLGPHALSQSTGMSFGEARQFIAKYFEIRPKLKELIAQIREQAEKQGYVETLLGRRRPTPDVHSSNFVVREAAYRAAVNMPFQGSAADIMKLAMVKVAAKLDEDCKMLLQIHDSILLEAPSAKAEKVSKMVKETMESAYKLPVKLKADISEGKNWGEL